MLLLHWLCELPELKVLLYLIEDLGGRGYELYCLLEAWVSVSFVHGLFTLALAS